MDCDGTGIVVASEKEQRESMDRGCVWLFRHRAARYSCFDSGDFASETTALTADVNKEFMADDETKQRGELALVTNLLCEEIFFNAVDILKVVIDFDFEREFCVQIGVSCVAFRCYVLLQSM